MKSIRLRTSIVGTDEGRSFNWSSGRVLEVGADVSTSYASRLVEVGQAVIEEEAPKKTTRRRKKANGDN